MVDTLSSDSKKVVQGLYVAIAADDVERFFGAMHPQFQAELPGYLPWGVFILALTHSNQTCYPEWPEWSTSGRLSSGPCLARVTKFSPPRQPTH